MGRFESRHERVIFVSFLLAASMAMCGAAVAQSDVARGTKLFAANCARCHGRGGKGDGSDLIKLQAAVSPDDFTDRETNRELTDKVIVSMITRGGEANGKSRIMPAFGTKLSAQQVRELLAFIRSLPK